MAEKRHNFVWVLSASTYVYSHLFPRICLKPFGIASVQALWHFFWQWKLTVPRPLSGRHNTNWTMNALSFAMESIVHSAEFTVFFIAGRRLYLFKRPYLSSRTEKWPRRQSYEKRGNGCSQGTSNSPESISLLRYLCRTARMELLSQRDYATPATMLFEQPQLHLWDIALLSRLLLSERKISFHKSVD